jgi:tRNA-binding EMAP/Myf-like protein
MISLKWICALEQSSKPLKCQANKLLILKVDTGIDVRTIVSGIAESFKPEDIVGKKSLS